MKEFFASKRFKILLAVLVMLCAFMLRAAWTGGFGTVTSGMLGAILSPIQSATASLSDRVAGFFNRFVRAAEIEQENEQLRAEIADLNRKIVDYDEVKHQNEIYKDFLGIKDRSPDLVFEPAQVSARDASDRFGSFNVDKGALDGINLRASAITADGIVGVVTEVGLTYAKISTILDPSVNIAAYDTRTRDTGVITGTIELAEQGLCKLTYLPRESGVAVGDLIATSGASGRYPKDLVIGKVVEVRPESHGNSMYAVIQPAADVRAIQDVLVIKSFAGQGASASAAVGGRGALLGSQAGTGDLSNAGTALNGAGDPTGDGIAADGTDDPTQDGTAADGTGNPTGTGTATGTASSRTSASSQSSRTDPPAEEDSP